MNTQRLMHFLGRFRLKRLTLATVTTKFHQSRSTVINNCGSPVLLNRQLNGNLFLSAGILSMFTKDEETPEDKLINNIKRSILCIQRGEHEKAEQMLHLALRMAQDLQNKDGITFVFDVMANLAMERGEFKKAEKLFVTVMQRLLADGYEQDDIKVSCATKVSSWFRFLLILCRWFTLAQK